MKIRQNFSPASAVLMTSYTQGDLTRNDLFDTICMICLIWMRKLQNRDNYLY